eukprot:g14410.t1
MLDVKTAFLQSPIDAPTYVRQPPGYEKMDAQGKPLVMKLNETEASGYDESLDLSPDEWDFNINPDSVIAAGQVASVVMQSGLFTDLDELRKAIMPRRGYLSPTAIARRSQATSAQPAAAGPGGSTFDDLLQPGYGSAPGHGGTAVPLPVPRGLSGQRAARGAASSCPTIDVSNSGGDDDDSDFTDPDKAKKDGDGQKGKGKVGRGNGKGKGKGKKPVTSSSSSSFSSSSSSTSTSSSDDDDDDDDFEDDSSRKRRKAKVKARAKAKAKARAKAKAKKAKEKEKNTTQKAKAVNAAGKGKGKGKATDKPKKPSMSQPKRQTQDKATLLKLAAAKEAFTARAQAEQASSLARSREGVGVGSQQARQARPGAGTAGTIQQDLGGQTAVAEAALQAGVAYRRRRQTSRTAAQPPQHPSQALSGTGSANPPGSLAAAAGTHHQSITDPYPTTLTEQEHQQGRMQLLHDMRQRHQAQLQRQQAEEQQLRQQLQLQDHAQAAGIGPLSDEGGGGAAVSTAPYVPYPQGQGGGAAGPLPAPVAAQPGQGGGAAGPAPAPVATQQHLQLLHDPRDPTLNMLALRLHEYKLAGSTQTVGHLRRLMAAVNAMRNSRVPGLRNVGEVYTYLGLGIASGTVSR